MLIHTCIMKPLPLAVFESIAFIARLTAFGANGFLFHGSIHATEHRITPQKNAPEYPTAGTGVGVLFRMSLAVQRLAVFRTTHTCHPEDDVSSGGYAVIQI